MAIPKIIHYCWFGKNPIPQSQLDYMKTWKKHMPNYIFKKWDETNFDVNMFAFTREAYEHKQYAFVSDVARLYALYMDGGVYMDTDNEVLKSFDPFLEHNWFTSVQSYWEGFKEEGLLQVDENRKPIESEENPVYVSELGFNSAVIGAERGSQYIKDCIDWYANKNFVDEEGNFYNKIIIPGIMAHIAIKDGFRYFDDYQYLRRGG